LILENREIALSISLRTDAEMCKPARSLATWLGDTLVYVAIAPPFPA
jgi:hypothetical protein